MCQLATKLTELQALFLKENPHISVDKLLNETLYAEVVHCFNGVFSTGSFGESSASTPALFAERSEVEAILGECGDDTEECEVMGVRWLANDELAFYCVQGDSSFFVGSNSAKKAMGMN